MDRIIEFFTNFYRDEPIYFWIAVALAAVLVILIIALIIAGISRSAKKKRARAASGGGTALVARASRRYSLTCQRFFKSATASRKCPSTASVTSPSTFM